MHRMPGLLPHHRRMHGRCDDVMPRHEPCACRMLVLARATRRPPARGGGVPRAAVHMHNAGPVGRRYHVGDTPMDIQAAIEAGAVPIGVATGIYTKQQLLDVAPGVLVLDSLASLPQALAALGLEQQQQ